MVVRAPANDRSVSFKCQVVEGTGRYSDNIIYRCRNGGLVLIIISPRDDGSIGPQCQAVRETSGYCGDVRKPRRDNRLARVSSVGRIISFAAAPGNDGPISFQGHAVVRAG